MLRKIPPGVRKHNPISISKKPQMCMQNPTQEKNTLFSEIEKALSTHEKQNMEKSGNKNLRKIHATDK
jgi:hypothetical protein